MYVFACLVAPGGLGAPFRGLFRSGGGYFYPKGMGLSWGSFCPFLALGGEGFVDKGDSVGLLRCPHYLGRGMPVTSGEVFPLPQAG